MNQSPADSNHRQLRRKWSRIRDLGAVLELMEWDQETQMPSKAAVARGRMTGTVAALRHEKLVEPALWEALQEAESSLGDTDGDPTVDSTAERVELRSELRLIRRECERARKIPERLVREIAAASATGLEAWRSAREKSDFSVFRPHLETLFSLRCEEAAAVDSSAPAYDVLLDVFEPTMTQAQLEPLFRQLRSRLVPLLERVRSSSRTPDLSPVKGHFPSSGQESFAKRCAGAFGFDFDAGRVDLSTHPFCLGIARQDVRMTWRFQEDDLRPALFGLLHETGHGLYEQGLPESADSSPVGAAVSLGIHESQSRLWENHVGRSLGFWRWALSDLRRCFLDHKVHDAEQMWPALHVVHPSLIRVEADEGTYNLHVILRFEIERRLFAGEIEVAELPEEWNRLSEELLGIRPPDDALGVLQDIHWSQGMFGYFPTYTLGTMAAAQLFETADREVGPLEDQFAEGEFSILLTWLREKIHRHGSVFTSAELIEKATGNPLGVESLIDYLSTNVERVYG